ncbi:MAG TPA: HAD family hydrolase [Candidatus Faeciplasma avium]|uniref:HAD family hydrolase n=1 Tax=Candidatus Faeciplasma avium TaxID=2840798 RepID=A0A9D1T4A2_9FIRM|nr:HAD family hydrolase [Candidatus Faeciplasma avium]
MDYSKLIFVTDMDGTLLTKNKGVSKRNLELIRRFQSQGGLFGLATGRPVHTTRRYLDILTPDLPLILYNGCIVYDHKTNSIVHGDYLPDAARDILKDIYSRFPGIAPEIFTFEAQYYLNLNEAERWHHEIVKVSYIKKSSGDEVQEPWCKLLFADGIEVINELSLYVKRFEGMGVRFVRSCPYFLEVLPEGVSKGSALKRILESPYYEGRVISSAGDYDNDIEMLKASDISFCPSDSLQSVKDSATHVLGGTCEEDVVAEAIEALSKL